MSRKGLSLWRLTGIVTGAILANLVTPALLLLWHGVTTPDNTRQSNPGPAFYDTENWIATPRGSPGLRGAADGVFERALAAAALTKADSFLPSRPGGGKWGWVHFGGAVASVAEAPSVHLQAIAIPSTCSDVSIRSRCLGEGIALLQVTAVSREHANVRIEWNLLGAKPRYGALRLALAPNGDDWQVESVDTLECCILMRKTPAGRQPVGLLRM